jgi:hypothetical protein
MDVFLDPTTSRPTQPSISNARTTITKIPPASTNCYCIGTRPYQLQGLSGREESGTKTVRSTYRTQVREGTRTERRYEPGQLYRRSSTREKNETGYLTSRRTMMTVWKLQKQFIDS